MKVCIGIAASVAFSLFTARASVANLVVNLAPQSGSAPLVVNPGESFTLNVIATIDDSGSGVGLQTAYGSIKTTGGAAANVTSVIALAPFNGNGVTGFQDTSNGLAALIDLDGDGDTDVGSTNAASTTNWLLLRSAAITSGNSFVLGTVTFNVPLNAEPGTSGIAAWDRRVPASGSSALWREGTNSVFSGSTTATELYLNGAGVQYSIAIPEPTMVGLLPMGSLALLRRVRRA